MLQYTHAAIAVLICTSQVYGATIADTFNPGDTHRSAGSAVTGPNSNEPDQDAAYMFLVQGSSYRFDGFKAGISRVTNESDTLDIALYDDNAMGRPGRPLEAFEINDVTLESSSDAMTSFVEASSVLHPLLQEGAAYWLVASSRGEMKTTWGHNSFPFLPMHLTRMNLGPWQQVLRRPELLDRNNRPQSRIMCP